MVNCDSNNEIYSFHRGGAHSLFADGSVRFFTESLDSRVLTALATPSQNDVSGADF
jgi:prepilin-type processing-associated H-X9-DG protein